METPIFPIFWLKCKEEKIIIPSTIDSITLAQFDGHYVGNGFFVSDKGIFATVAHVLNQVEENCMCQVEECSNYALLDDAFYKINILYKKHINKNEENEIDAAIGKIKIDIDVSSLQFGNVTQELILDLTGYSRILLPEKNKNYFVFKDQYNNNFYKIRANFQNLKCYDISYNINMNNFLK